MKTFVGSGAKVGDNDDDDGMGEGEEEGEGEAGADVEVEDLAGATFNGHSDAVYCVAVNPKNSSQVNLGEFKSLKFLWASGFPARVNMAGYIDWVRDATGLNSHV